MKGLLKESIKQAKANKYNAKKVEIDGIKFDSKREGQRYATLKLMWHAGEISNLTIKPSEALHVNGVLIGHYTPDFEYIQKGVRVVEEVKGKRTEAYVLRRKVFEAVHGIKILET